MIRYFLLALVFIHSTNAFANDVFPKRIVVPFSAGGHTDIIARKLSFAMSKMITANVIVDNRPGAGGIIGASIVAKSNADGNTFFISGMNQVIVPDLFPNKFNDNPYKELRIVGSLASSPLILVTNVNQNFNTIPEFINFAKNNSKQVSFASTDIKGSSHLAGELLNQKLNMKMLNIPFNGNIPAINQILSGNDVSIAILAVASVFQYVKSDQLRGIALLAENRMSILPHIPTIKELLISDKELFISPKQIIMVRSNTPTQIVQSINKLISNIMSQSEIKSGIESMGFSVNTSPTNMLEKEMAAEIIKWKKVINNANLNNL